MIKNSLKIWSGLFLQIASVSVYANDVTKVIGIAKINNQQDTYQPYFINKFTVNKDSFKFTCINNTLYSVEDTVTYDDGMIGVPISGKYNLSVSDCKFDKKSAYYTFSSFEVEITNSGGQVEICTIGGEDANLAVMINFFDIALQSDLPEYEYIACNKNSQVKPTGAKDEYIRRGYFYHIDNGSLLYGPGGLNLFPKNDNITIMSANEF